MELSGVVETLGTWAEAHRLVEAATAAFDQWMSSRGGAIGGFSRDDIQVAFYNQSLVFATGPHAVGPVVVTSLDLSVYGGECPLGTFKLLSHPDGRRRGIEVELGAAAELDGLAGDVWRFYE